MTTSLDAAIVILICQVLFFDRKSHNERPSMQVVYGITLLTPESQKDLAL